MDDDVHGEEMGMRVGGDFPRQVEDDPFYNPVIPSMVYVGGTAKIKKGKGNKKMEGKQPTFLTKLYQ